MPVSPYEFCWPAPGPGLYVQSLVHSEYGTGDAAFGLTNGSVKGLRISGLVGNTAVYTRAANACELASKTPLGHYRPLRRSSGTISELVVPTATAAAPTAPSFRNDRRGRCVTRVGSFGSLCSLSSNDVSFMDSSLSIGLVCLST